MWSKSNKRFVLALGTLVLIAIAGFWYYRYSEIRRHTFRVTFLNIGQGDSALINFANGEKMLVDCGPADNAVLARLGFALGFFDRTIDYVLSTHPDRDHYGGCAEVVRRYQVKHIITNGRKKTYDSYWREWDKIARQSGAELITIASPITLIIAGDTLQFVSPDPSFSLDTSADDHNNYSIVFRLTHGSKHFLFVGDAEEPLERAIIAKYCLGLKSDCPLRAEVLKVGHHGSNSSSGEDFLEAVAPRQAIISVGKNKYGHPSPRVLQHLKRAGAEILRTDLLGEVVTE